MTYITCRYTRLLCIIKGVYLFTLLQQHSRWHFIHRPFRIKDNCFILKRIIQYVIVWLTAYFRMLWLPSLILKVINTCIRLIHSYAYWNGVGPDLLPSTTPIGKLTPWRDIHMKRTFLFFLYLKILHKFYTHKRCPTFLTTQPNQKTVCIVLPE